MRAAEDLFDQGQYAYAEAKCLEIEKLWPPRQEHRDSSVAHLLGRIRMRQGRYQDAIRIMAPNPESSDVGRLDLALCYVRVGDLERAGPLYDPRLITGYNSAFPDAGRFLPRVRSGSDLEGALLWCKGVALSNVGRAGEAADCYAAALRRLPGNPLLAARLGLAAENAGRFRQAADAFAAVRSSGDASMRAATRWKFETTSALAKAASAKTEAGARP